MSGSEATVWLNALLGSLQWTQHGMLVLLHTFGLTGETHGQPAQPWDVRIAGETLLTDLGQVRQLGLTLVALMLALVAVVIAAFVRR